MYNNRSGKIRLQYPTSYSKAIVMFALYLPFAKYSQNKKNANIVTLKMKVKEQTRNV